MQPKLLWRCSSYSGRRHGAHASFMLNWDDDVFAHPEHHLSVGQLTHSVCPVRRPWSKYYVPKVVTEEEHYPPYCGGGGFLLSRFTATALRHSPPPWTSSPLLMSSWACAKSRRASHSGILTAGVQAPSSCLSSFDPCFYRELPLVHRFLPYEMLLMGDVLNQSNLTCDKRTQIY
ncbi:N-acetyllactosaminide beta-1,3-N-acetylglucosaminyltransferase 3, partial [Eschrichtius robustus]|nr:N-acetyllactosaminide beta-1,3-N-acetylglucosaminyltransferase 3 [Eschrichtius robustus]